MCNFTNERKLLVSGGESRFPSCYIVIGEQTFVKEECDFTNVSATNLSIKSSLLCLFVCIQSMLVG